MFVLHLLKQPSNQAYTGVGNILRIEKKLLSFRSSLVGRFGWSQHQSNTIFQAFLSRVPFFLANNNFSGYSRLKVLVVINFTLVETKQISRLIHGIKSCLFGMLWWSPKKIKISSRNNKDYI